MLLCMCVHFLKNPFFGGDGPRRGCFFFLPPRFVFWDTILLERTHRALPHLPSTPCTHTRRGRSPVLVFFCFSFFSIRVLHDGRHSPFRCAQTHPHTHTQYADTDIQWACFFCLLSPFSLFSYCTPPLSLSPPLIHVRTPHLFFFSCEQPTSECVYVCGLCGMWDVWNSFFPFFLFDRFFFSGGFTYALRTVSFFFSLSLLIVLHIFVCVRECRIGLPGHALLHRAATL